MPDINLIPTEYKKKRVGLGAIFSRTIGMILILLILSLLAYGGLLIYKKSLAQEISDLNKSIAELESKRDNKLENSIYRADKKLKSVESLFKIHFYWSKVFTKIEQLVVSDVYFTESKAIIDNGKISLTLSGNSKSYTGIARQMVSFGEDTMVEKVELSDIKLNDVGEIEFTLSILFLKDILINQTIAEQ